MPGNRFINFKLMWRKESNGLYVNIDPNGPHDSPNFNEAFYEYNQQKIKLVPKDNKKSLKYRNLGNSEFVKNKWYNAMQFYNQSLCFAETETENVALAFGNRSACFFFEKKFEQCLVDIELAIKANYPQRLMPKLEKRRDDCLKRLEISEQKISIKPELSFQPNEKHPSLANVLEINYDTAFGRHITAKEDIDVGKTILIEKSFVSKAMFGKNIRCDICLRSRSNLVPCKQCTTSLFCIGECDNHFLHKFECTMKADDDEASNDGLMQVVRSILIAINTVPGIDNLIKFVEQTIAGEPMKIPEYEPVDNLSKYRVFLELSFPQATELSHMFNCRIYTIYKTLLQHREIAAMFQSKRYKRFLKHLIAHHESVIKYNCQSSYELGGKECITNLQPLMGAYFNHSCAPNVATLSYDAFYIAVAVRPIKRGEQLLISYLGLDAWSLVLHQSPASREAYLLKYHGFQCFCKRCRTTRFAVSSSDSDECYKYQIENYHQKLDSIFDQEKTNKLQEKCAEFMRKYGRQEWTDEMSLVMLCYVHMLSLHMNFALNV